MSLQHRLRAAWTRRGPLAALLWPLSRLYGALAARERRAYQSGAKTSDRLPVPVVVVGNVIAGGAGKTPTTLAIVEHLKSRGWRPGIVSRGHGRATGDCREVLPDADPRDVGDEPLLLRQRAEVPVFVAAQRAEAGRALLATHSATDVLVCDDGLQHLALARDVEICVFDARGIGNGWLLPAGPLREPWPRAVDLVLWTEPAAHLVPPPLGEGWGGGHPAVQPAPPAPHPSPLPKGAREPDRATLALTPDSTSDHAVLPLPLAGEGRGEGTRSPATEPSVPTAPHFTATRRLSPHALRADGTRVPLSDLRGQPLTAIAGIARPEAFFTMLRAAGLTLAETIALPDHHDFNGLSRLTDKRQSLICTEKDAVKLWRHAPDALAVPLLLEVPPAFFAALDQRLAAQGYHPSQHPDAAP